MDGWKWEQHQPLFVNAVLTPHFEQLSRRTFWNVVSHSWISYMFPSHWILIKLTIEYCPKGPMFFSKWRFLFIFLSGKNYSQGLLVGFLKWQRLSCLIWRMAFPSRVWKMKKAAWYGTFFKRDRLGLDDMFWSNVTVKWATHINLSVYFT